MQPGRAWIHFGAAGVPSVGMSWKAAPFVQVHGVRPDFAGSHPHGFVGGENTCGARVPRRIGRANVKVAQKMPGRSSAAMTLDTYADLLDGDLDAVSDALDHAVSQAKVGKMCPPA